MSRAPLFGSDTRLGHVSVPLDDLITPLSGAPLAYRCEALCGAKGGELVAALGFGLSQRPGAHHRLQEVAGHAPAALLWGFRQGADSKSGAAGGLRPK